MYVSPNFPTKKRLKEAVAAGEPVAVFEPGIDGGIYTGDVSVEGPHYPKPHSWYARVRMVNRKVVKVLS